MKNKIYIYIILLISILGMSIGYSALNTELNISGEALVIHTQEVIVTDISFVSQYNGYEKYTAEMINNKATFFPHLNNIYATLKYSVTITNYTSENQVYLGFLEEYSNKYLSFRIDGLSVGHVLAPRERITFTVTFSNLSGSQQSGSIGITFNFGYPDENSEIATVLTGATSTLESYVRTGFYPSVNSRFIVEFTMTEPRSVSTWIFSSRRAYQNQMFGVAFNTTESLLQFNTISYNLGATGFKYDVKHTADVSKNAMILDGRNYYDPPDTYWQSIFELYLFANNEGRWIRGHVNGTTIIHSIKLYENDVLIIDAVPVELTTGEVVFWNNVTNIALETVGSLVGIYE